MRIFFAVILLISFEIIPNLNAIKVTVLAFGNFKNSSQNKPVGPYPFSLDVIKFAFDEVFFGKQRNVDLNLIHDECTLDFDWQEKNMVQIENILNHNPNERFMHIGPLCEYPYIEAANVEILGYMKDITNNNRSKIRNHVFLTPTLVFNVKTNDLFHTPHHYSNGNQKTSTYEPGPLFVKLNSYFEAYAQLIYDFTIRFLSPYTAFLCPVKVFLGHMDTFCHQIVSHVIRMSSKNNQNLFRFRYFGSKENFDWKNIWNNIMQRSRYVIFCGDDEYFAEWLESGKQLWSIHKIEEFAIFFLNVNFESSNFSPLLSDRDSFMVPALSGVKDLGNIKILNIRSPVDCSELDEFCSRFSSVWKKLVYFPLNGSKWNERIFTNKILFYSLSVYKLFATMSKSVSTFWLHTDTEDHFETKYKTNKGLEVYEITRLNKGIKPKKACSIITKVDRRSVCNLGYIDGKAPAKVPGPCGFYPCELPPDDVAWITLVRTVGCIVGAGLITVIISVVCYFHRRKNEWAVTPVGGVRIKIYEVKPLDDDTSGTKSETAEKSKTTSTRSMNLSIRLDPVKSVLGTYRSNLVIVKPFKVSKNRLHSVDDAVTELRSFVMENVSQILGFIVQDMPLVYGLVMQYGEHGVLKTLLQLAELDLALKLPLMADLCRALENIHKSSLKYHGNLSSLCCVVDSHFVLKVMLADFLKLKTLDLSETTNSRDSETTSTKLWSAPEILRHQPNVNLELADIYSFGIIAHEIIYQKGPFYVSPKDLAAARSPKDGVDLPKTSHDIAIFVINVLKDKNRRQIRPSFITRPGEEAVMVILKDMIKSCWKDNPTQRCTLTKISACVRKVMCDMNIVNVFGSIVERLEFYSKHLQEAVQQKADKVEQERRRVRRVLEQLFPGIAISLIKGEKPEPVKYSHICVYYNDLVGFTKICSDNTSSTVAKFLNTLFLKYDSVIELYNIHPVTRIGDAYMLVSGIPIEFPGKYHAMEIAQAALQLVEAVRTTEFDYVKNCKTMQIRTGIASGKAASGVVGSEIPSFGICGDAVVIASAMENNSEPMRILVAESSYTYLKDEFEFEPKTKEVMINNMQFRGHWLIGMKKVSKILLNHRLDGKPRYERKFDETSSTLS